MAELYLIADQKKRFKAVHKPIFDPERNLDKDNPLGVYNPDDLHINIYWGWYHNQQKLNNFD